MITIVSFPKRHAINYRSALQTTVSTLTPTFTFFYHVNFFSTLVVALCLCYHTQNPPFPPEILQEHLPSQVPTVKSLFHDRCCFDFALLQNKIPRLRLNFIDNPLPFHNFTMETLSTAHRCPVPAPPHLQYTAQLQPSLPPLPTEELFLQPPRYPTPMPLHSQSLSPPPTLTISLPTYIGFL